MRRALLLLLLLLIGGCASTPVYHPAKPLPPVDPPASVTPAAEAVAGAVAAIEPPIADAESAAGQLSAFNGESLRPVIQRALAAVRTAWQRAVTAAAAAKQGAKVNDEGYVQVMEGMQARDEEIARLGQQSAAQQKQIEAAASEFQKKVNMYAILLTVIVAVIVALLCYQTAFKAAICTAIGGTGAILFLMLVGWVDRFKLEIGMTFVGLGLLYLVTETLLHKFHGGLSWADAFYASLTEAPVAK